MCGRNRRTGILIPPTVCRRYVFAAATFVMTRDDLRRSGVTSIAEALRMVPGVHAAQIDSSKWAISARGFNGRFANKLLVLIDGRTVYTPTFRASTGYPGPHTGGHRAHRGVPGASVWGGNAVNEKNLRRI